MNDLLQIAILAAIAGVGLLLRNIVGARKNIDVFSTKFDSKKFINTLVNWLATGVILVISVGVISYVLGKATDWDISIVGAEITDIAAVKTALAVSAVAAWGTVIWQILEWRFLSKQQADALRQSLLETTENEDKIVQAKLSFDEQGNIQADFETATEKPAIEDIGEIGEVVTEEAGKGGIVNNYPEPYRSVPQDSLIDPSRMYNRECTSYAAFKQGFDSCFIKTAGKNNAKNWLANAATWGKATGSEPVVGAVAVWTSGQYGHVSHVEAVNSGTITISEYNYSVRGGFGVREVPKNSPNGYIYFGTKPSTPKPSPTPAPTQPEAPANNAVKIGDRVTTTAIQDAQNNLRLNLNIINDGQSVYAGQNSRGNAVLTYQTIGGVVRTAVKYESLRKI